MIVTASEVSKEDKSPVRGRKLGWKSVITSGSTNSKEDKFPVRGRKLIKRHRHCTHIVCKEDKSPVRGRKQIAGCMSDA